MDNIADQFDAAEDDDQSIVIEDDLEAATLDIEIDVNFQKKPFTALHLREPKAREIERAERELNVTEPTPYHFRRYQIELIAAVAKVPREVVGELTASQLRRAWNFLRVKLGEASPPTGATS